MKFLILIVLATLGLVACLPNVSTEMSEPEARAVLQRDILSVCSSINSPTLINNILTAVERSEAIATRDNWIFMVRLSNNEEPLEALVFPSRVVAGSFATELMTRTCRS